MFPACDLYQIPLPEYQRQTVRLEDSAAKFDGEAFKSAIFQRLFAITVPAKSKDAVIGLVSKLQTVLEGIILQGAGGMFTACMIGEVKLVGQYQKDTTVAGPRELYAEIVVTLKSVPTVSSLRALGTKIVSDLMSNYPTEEFGFSLDEYRLSVSSAHATVIVHVTAPPQPVPVGDSPVDSDLIPNEVLEANARLVDEANWFAGNASASNIKGLVRLLTDIRQRHPSLGILRDAALDLLAHFCVTGVSDGSGLSIEAAFRRFLELLSMGILLRDAWPTTELFLYQEVDVAARAAATAEAVDLLCQISSGSFHSALTV